MNGLCILPWISLFIDEYGHFFPCCQRIPGSSAIKDENGELIKAVGQSGFWGKAWNSPQMTTLRKQMLNGEFPERCQQCYRNEKLGLASVRKIFNQKFSDHFNILAQTDSEGVLEDNLVFLDIRFGNECNLSCRMCSPQFSKKLIPEFQMIHTSVTFDKEQGKSWYKDNDLFWNELQNNASRLEFISIAGGEPLIIPEVFQMLDLLVKLNVSSQIELMIITNLSVLPEKFFSLISDFKSTGMVISIDGFNEINEYIRYPSKWQVIDKNLELLALKAESCRINATTCATVQIYNVFSLLELCRYVASKAIFSKAPDLNLVAGHEWLSIQALPENLKEVAKQRLLAIKEDSLLAADDALAAQVDGLISYMFAADRSVVLDQFRRQTEIMDQMRKQNILNYVPELSSIFN